MSVWLSRYDAGIVGLSFSLLCLSCLFVTRGYKYLCIVASGTIRFLFRPCYLLVICVGLIAALRRRYRLSLFLFFAPFLYLRDERLGVLLPLCLQFYLFCCYRLCNFCREARCVDADVIGNFLLFCCFRLFILWRDDWCVSFLFYFPVNSLALLIPNRPS